MAFLAGVTLVTGLMGRRLWAQPLLWEPSTGPGSVVVEHMG